MSHIGPRYKSVHIRETVKVAEIRDALDNLRFKVTLTSYDTAIEDQLVPAYQIQVINYYYGQEPLIVLDKPDDGEPEILDYGYALNFYNECVKNYSALVKAETRDFQDIDVYKEKIQYKITCPACCATCKWCKFKTTPHNIVFGVTNKPECMNPKNVHEYLYDIVPAPQDKDRMAIHPKVKLLGVCMNYEVRTVPYRPLPGDDIISIVDRRVDRRQDDFYKSKELSSQVSEIAEQAASKMAIEQIIGNKNLNMKDNNNNDIDDEYEVIFGDIGA